MPAIDHVIVLVLENRSFDHMLGFLTTRIPLSNASLKMGGTPTPAGPAVRPSRSAAMLKPSCL